MKKNNLTMKILQPKFLEGVSPPKVNAEMTNIDWGYDLIITIYTCADQTR